MNPRAVLWVFPEMKCSHRRIHTIPKTRLNTESWQGLESTFPKLTLKYECPLLGTQLSGQIHVFLGTSVNSEQLKARLTRPHNGTKAAITFEKATCEAIYDSVFEASTTILNRKYKVGQGRRKESTETHMSNAKAESVGQRAQRVYPR